MPASEGPTGFLHMSLKLGRWESRRKAQTLVQFRARHQCRGLNQHSATDSLS